MKHILYILMLNFLTFSTYATSSFSEQDYYDCNQGDIIKCSNLYQTLLKEQRFEEATKINQRICYDEKKHLSCAYFATTLSVNTKFEEAVSVVGPFCVKEGLYCDVLGGVYFRKYFNSNKKDMTSYTKSEDLLKFACSKNRQSPACIFLKILQDNKA